MKNKYQGIALVGLALGWPTGCSKNGDDAVGGRDALAAGNAFQFNL